MGLQDIMAAQDNRGVSANGVENGITPNPYESENEKEDEDQEEETKREQGRNGVED